MGRPKQPPEQIFWSKVKVAGPDECWIWQASRRGQYGGSYLNGRPESAHRVSYVLHFGPIPDGMMVMHKCDVPLCVNPAHLELGTQLDNVRDRERKGRGNHPRGAALRTGAKLNDEKVREIRRLIAEGKSQRWIARELGITQPMISMVNTKKYWAYVE